MQRIYKQEQVTRSSTLSSVVVLDKVLGRLNVFLNHLLNKCIKPALALPPEQPARFSRITEEQAKQNNSVSVTEHPAPRSRQDVLDFGRAEVLLINLDDSLPGLRVITFFMDAIAPPSFVPVLTIAQTAHRGLNSLDLIIRNGESLLDKLTHRVRLTRCENEVLRLFLLKHQPHALDIVTGYRRTINVSQPRPDPTAQGAHHVPNHASRPGYRDTRHLACQDECPQPRARSCA